MPDELPRLSDAQAESLIMPVTKFEIFQTLKSMSRGKAPGPNGLNTEFFRAFWNRIGNGISEAIGYFFMHGRLPRDWNQTHISLIPKKENPQKVTEFRPISLCNVNYKIIAKILANRLKLILPSLVGKEQSAFVGGRSIFDNILLTQELTHSLEFDTQTNPMMLIKMDMEKAYDLIR
ncbi:hypothetical protein J5N97_004824 [Dioscorea zingiberensis]|uniref:Reverse transcriptase domain-containing protein n=1 Tax=Dioscorea zingiberensis TaxID=325984 RepID=A0A9D5D936_9LILI|nr:hypothetical protein J5N97_004824 [Dioscorea zingiberensis]